MPFRSNKPARLEKQRTNDYPGTRHSPARYDDSDDTSLRSPNRYSIQSLSTQQLVTRQRQLLLRQFSENSVTSKNGQERVGRSPSTDHHVDPKGSSSTVNTIVNDIEARTRIDVEQAIGLLQELKKTASPDELVALHRALLPVKEDTPPPVQRPSIEERAYTSVPPDRRRSVIPPGLATRSGMSDDVLRKQSEPSTVEALANSRKDLWTFETPKAQPRNDSPSRLSTKSEQAYCHAGAFASGTLRITNGAASPEPSVISKLALESNDAEDERKVVPPDQDVDPRRSFQSLRERRSEDSGSVRPHRSPIKQLQRRETLRPAGPRPGSLDFNPGERSKARAELRLDPPLQRHSFQHIPDPASEDVPRFQQRWGHRAAFLSQEYALDCDITESPYEEKNGLVDFAKRLSTVHDDGESEVGDNGDADSRADALSRLTGVFEEAETAGNNDIGTARTSDEAEPASHNPSPAQDKVVRKVDSGYCSDASISPLQRKSSAEAGKPKNAPAIQEQPGSPHGGSDPRGQARHLSTDTCDSIETSSLLTFEEMVSSSPQTQAATTSSPSQTTKKSPLSLFKSKSKASRKGSFNVLNVYHGDRPRTSDGLDKSSSAQPSPPPSRSGPGDKVKKLQKPMPDSIRRQRKKTMEDLKSSMSEHSPTVQNLLADEPAKQEDSDCFVGCQPKDAVEDGEEADSKPKSLRQRSKSFVGRRRSKTVGESQEESTQSPASPAPARKRSKSHADRTPPIPLSASEDHSSSMNCLKSSEPNTPARDRPVPMHTDFASVARALQSHPPDPSKEASRSVPVPKRSSMQRYYSVHKIVTDLDHPDTKKPKEPEHTQSSQPDEGSQRPLEPTNEANTGEYQPPVPPHHTPAVVPASSPTTPVAVGSSYSVEDRFPGWQGKPASPNATPPQTPVASPSSSMSWLPLRHNRSQSVIAAGIPPLPELPADIAAKVSRADQMVAKKLRLSPRGSPNGSARNSIDSVDTRKQLLAKKAEARREQDEHRSNDARQAAFDQLNVPREEDEDASNRSVTDSARWSVDGSIQLPRPQEQALPASPTHDSQHPGWPGWEQQSNLWRQRREALAQSFESSEKTPIEEPSEQACESPSTPGIVVSRYITPLAAENVHNANRASKTENDSAKKYADEYTSLIEDDKENTPSRPAVPRADSVVSTATFVTMQSTEDRSARMDGSRPSSALSSYTTTTTVSSTTSYSNGPSSRSPFNRDRQQHMRTKSGRFLPYRPTDASHAERSRALSLARRSCQMTASSESLVVPAQRPELKKSSSESLFDRYGGGMQYGWDRNSGSFGGSAGTRSKTDGECKDNRKSVKMSEEFGLDLSDIPVYLRKGESFSTVHHG